MDGLVGVIYDFAGPYTIGVDDFAFGRVTRYLQVQQLPQGFFHSAS